MIDVPVVLVVQVPWVRVLAETAEIPQLPFVKKIGVIPETAEIPQVLSDVRGVVQNIGIDSFIDDLRNVDSKGLNYQDCEVLFHVNKQRPDIAGGVHVIDVPVVTRRAAHSSTITTNKSHGQNRQCKKEKETKEKRERKVMKKEKRVREERRRKEGKLRKKGTKRSRRT